MSTTRRPNDPTLTTLSATAQATLDDIADIEEAAFQHVDYDRHPLRVQGLGHYIDPQESSERFHIS